MNLSNKIQHRTSRLSSLSGFTVVELLVVIVVIGILAATSVVGYNGVQSRTAETVVKNDLAQAAKQIEISRLESGVYPASESQAGEGVGFTRTNTTEYIYTSDGEGYELTGFTERQNTKKFCINSVDRSVREGECAGHSWTDASCFTFSSSTGTITNYLSIPTCPKDVKIPRNISGVPVTILADDAFYNKQITSVNIPNSVVSIGAGVFQTNLLTSASIPDSVVSLGNQSFSSNQISNLYIGNSVNSIGNYVFYMNNLTDVVIPDSVDSIGVWAFASNQLTGVSIGDSVTSIGRSSFYNNQLTSVTIPSSVTSMGERAFQFNEGIVCRVSVSAPFNPSYANMECGTIERY